MKLKSSPVKIKAQELGLPVETPEKARDPEFVQRIQSLEADVHVVAAYGQILSTKLLETAKRGGINLHGSILPEYRGAAPIQRAIMDGKTETGVTLMQMDKGMDTGDIIDIVRTLIGPDETYGELHARLSHLAAGQIKSWIERIVGGDYPREPQNHEQATYAPKILPEEKELHIDRDARAEYNRYRGLSPTPGCHIFTQAGRLRLLEIKLRPSDSSTASSEMSEADDCLIGGVGGTFELVSVLPDGKRPMSGRAWSQGAREFIIVKKLIS